MLFHRRRSGQRCKNYCDAYGSVQTAYAELLTQYNEMTTETAELRTRCNEMEIETAQFQSFLSDTDKGRIILGASVVNGHMVETTIQDGIRDKTVSLRKLPHGEYERLLCIMCISYGYVSETYRTACIVDWKCRVENAGYGSELMARLINYLKTSGFSYLTGSICPVDFNHEDKLRHFYTKFGFEITDYPDHRALKLKL